MLSHLTMKGFELYYRYCCLFCLPYRWDKAQGHVRVKTSLFSQFIWKSMGFLHIAYLIWVAFRFGQSIKNKVNMQNLIFHSLSLAIRVENLGCLLTTPVHWKGIGRSMNQLFFSNQKLLSLLSDEEKQKLHKKDIYGVVVGFFVFAVYFYPFTAITFYLVFPNVEGYAYTAIPAEFRYKLRYLLIPIFGAWEWISGFYISATAVLYILHASACFMHSAYWMKFASERVKTGKMTVKRAQWIYRMQQIFIQTVNYNLSGIYLPVVKEALSLMSVVNCFTAIRFFDKLDWKTLPVLGFVSGGAFLALCTVYMVAGLVWKQSLQLYEELPRVSKISKKELMIHKSMRPFGIMIGSFYPMKHYTTLHTLAILVQNLCTMLIMFK